MVWESGGYEEGCEEQWVDERLEAHFGGSLSVVWNGDMEGRFGCGAMTMLAMRISFLALPD